MERIAALAGADGAALGRQGQSTVQGMELRPLAPAGGFDRPQRLDLATDPDHQQPLHARLLDLL